jgi:8-oxo-dGTP diphosphatase
MSLPLRVAAGIALDRDRLFLARRAEGRSSGGLWEFPGGKIEVAEDGPACLIREFREEFGADILPGEPFLEVVRGEISLACHFVKLLSPIKFMADHGALAWVPREDLRAFRFCPADEAAIEKILADQQWPSGI